MNLHSCKSGHCCWWSASLFFCCNTVWRSDYWYSACREL